MAKKGRKKYNYKEVIESANRGNDKSLREAYKVYSEEYDRVKAKQAQYGFEMRDSKLPYNRFKNYYGASALDIELENKNPTPKKIAQEIVDREAYSRTRKQAKVLQELGKTNNIRMSQRAIMSGIYNDEINNIIISERDKYIQEYQRKHGIKPPKRQIREFVRTNVIGSP